MVLLVRIGDLDVTVWLAVVNESAVDTIVETYFKNRYVWGIFPFSRKITSRNSTSV